MLHVIYRALKKLTLSNNIRLNISTSDLYREYLRTSHLYTKNNRESRSHSSDYTDEVRPVQKKICLNASPKSYRTILRILSCENNVSLFRNVLDPERHVTVLASMQTVRALVSERQTPEISISAPQVSVEDDQMQLRNLRKRYKETERNTKKGV